jgi:hypothetical protein
MTFVVKCHPYAHDILFSLNGKWNDTRTKLVQANMTKDDIATFKAEFDDYAIDSKRGRCWQLSNGQQVIRMAVPMNAKTIALLSHEVLHAVSFILRRVGIEHTSDTEEAYTYLHQYVMSEVLTLVAKRHWK